MTPPPRSREMLLALLLTVLVSGRGRPLPGRRAAQRGREFLLRLWHQCAGERYRPANIVIVAVDDETLDEYPDDPLVCWTPHFARG